MLFVYEWMNGWIGSWLLLNVYIGNKSASLSNSISYLSNIERMLIDLPRYNSPINSSGTFNYENTNSKSSFSLGRPKKYILQFLIQFNMSTHMNRIKDAIAIWELNFDSYFSFKSSSQRIDCTKCRLFIENYSLDGIN